MYRVSSFTLFLEPIVIWVNMEQRVMMKFLVNDGIKLADICGRLQGPYVIETHRRVPRRSAVQH